METYSVRNTVRLSKNSGQSGQLKIGILGTRGIPNAYGGFEQISTFLAEGLVRRGHQVTVYNSHNHPYTKATFNGVGIIRCFDPERYLGTAGQFIYDLNCILDARRRSFDVLLFMGYTSSSVWKGLFPSGPVIISNMDGLEWQRARYSKPVQRFLQYAERLAVQSSDFHIADSRVMAEYLERKYQVKAQYIPYGAEVKTSCDEDYLANWQLPKKEYIMLVARMVPENNVAMILEGFKKSNTSMRCLVVGDVRSTFGRQLQQRFSDDARIIFSGALFDQEALHSLRKFAALYFHGHSVGGTNPSLLEAMSSRVLIAAHGNEFNRSILGEDALYFSSANEIAEIIPQYGSIDGSAMIENNYNKVLEKYQWAKITDAYEDFIKACHKQKNYVPAIA